MRASLVLTLVSSVALAQGAPHRAGGSGVPLTCASCALTEKSLTLQAASSQDALTLLQGAKINLGGSRIWWDGTSIIFGSTGVGVSGNTYYGSFFVNGSSGSTTVNSTVPDSASAVSVVLTSPALVTSGAKIASFQNSGTEKLAVDKDGRILPWADNTVDLGSTAKKFNTVWGLAGGFSYLYDTGGSQRYSFSSNTNAAQSTVADGASAVAHSFSTSNTLATAGAKVLQVKNNANEVAAIDLNGQYTGGLNLNGGANVNQLATPTGVTLGATSGTLGAGTYYYRVSATHAAGTTVAFSPSNTAETLASAEQSITVGASAGVTVSWSYVPGATGYKVYGRTTGAELLIGTVAAGNTLSFTDTGSVTPSGALPTVNSTGTIKLGNNQALVFDTASATSISYDGAAFRFRSNSGFNFNASAQFGGNLSFVNSTNGLTLGYIDNSGSPGTTTTINAYSGRAALSNATTNIVVTNSVVTATSKVMVQLESVGVGVVGLVVVPAAGTFTVTAIGSTGAAVTPSATCKFSFIVTN